MVVDAHPRFARHARLVVAASVSGSSHPRRYLHIHRGCQPDPDGCGPFSLAIHRRDLLLVAATAAVAAAIAVEQGMADGNSTGSGSS